MCCGCVVGVFSVYCGGIVGALVVFWRCCGGGLEGVYGVIFGLLYTSDAADVEES